MQTAVKRKPVKRDYWIELTGIKPLKHYWVVVFPQKRDNEKLTPAPWSIAGNKKHCIELFLEDSNMTWEACCKLGYRAVKVNINFTF